MLLQVNCRGYASAQFMQPEPARYARGPSIEATTFMQPEQPHYAHHPGRFVYVKDEADGSMFSVPYEPTRSQLDAFSFIVEDEQISWLVRKGDLTVRWAVQLAANHTLERWTLTVTNDGDSRRQLSLYPYFPVGYMSWMNQSAAFSVAHCAVICSSITPYQRTEDYFKQRGLKDLTVLLAEHPPVAFETRQAAFEGEGGLGYPSSIEQTIMSNSEATYETPTAALQYQTTLEAGDSQTFRFGFGPANNEAEIEQLRQVCFQDQAVEALPATRRRKSCLQVATPDPELDRFVNHWLGRQVAYHGQINRLSTDPQTRNYLQDAMGMSFVEPSHARDAFVHALSQQHGDGSMPDGVLLNPEASLKYINQIPHSDHALWLPICLDAYLAETGDYELLSLVVPFADSDTASATVFEHVNRALQYLSGIRDARGLSLIDQGDWCDPMNMVGYKGKGVSSWLTVASAYAMKVWADVCRRMAKPDLAAEFWQLAAEFNEATNREFWHLHWYARGITDDGDLFGIADDAEGKIFLNPQSWAMLSGAADTARTARLVDVIKRELQSPHGVELLSPAYTAMRTDIGRVTQKHPGTAENGSVYNHAAAFYIYALYQQRGRYADDAYQLLRQMIPGPDESELVARGQLPVFIPNYYRGAHRQFPRTAGRSSQLFNTGTVHWYLRCLIEGLFGVHGAENGLRVSPQLPSHWLEAQIKRHFRGATMDIRYERTSEVSGQTMLVDGQPVAGDTIEGIRAGQHYKIVVRLPLIDSC